MIRWTRSGLLIWCALHVAPGAAQPEAAGACIAPVTYIPLDKAVVGTDDNGVAALGTYERISPDGRFILRSYSGARLGQVSLIELPASADGAVKVYRTPFSNEAFPVQGTWRYLVDVSGEHYRFKDVLQRQSAAQPLFKAGMTGFYAAASELTVNQEPTSSPGQIIHIRSLSWPQNADPDAQGIGPLQTAMVEILDSGSTAKVLNSVGPRFICSQRRTIDGGVYALPMLSVDGLEFSAIPQAPRAGKPTMRVYGLSTNAADSNHPCDERADLGSSPSKAVFGYPRDGESPLLTFSDVGHVYAHDRRLAKTFRLDHTKYGVLASAFPGLTRDGRVIYGATWRNCDDRIRCPKIAGYVIADPYQSREYRTLWESRRELPPKPCIMSSDVMLEHARFSKFHDL